MATYNTRGQKHRGRRKDFDFLYNKGFVWAPLLDELYRQIVEKSASIRFSNHVRNYACDGNREYSISAEITKPALLAGEVVEVETELNDYCGNDFQTIRKAVVRLPAREDGEQVVVVVEFNYRADMFVKTAWLNKASDNHQTGLDTTDFDNCVSDLFGFFFGRWQSVVYDNTNIASPKKLLSDVAMTMEEYNRRCGYATV